MYRLAPQIDPRSAQEVFEHVGNLLAKRTHWSRPDPTAEALIRIFARYAEIVIDRLNRVPEKNFVAFLDLLGAAPIPPLPARVPLTFFPVDGTVAAIRVPAQTQVAAPPDEGETEPVVFETERPLELTTSKLCHVFLLDPRNDVEFELDSLADAVVSDVAALWGVGRPSGHVLYLAHSGLFVLAQNASLRLKFEIETGLPAAYGRSTIEWGILTADKEIPLTPASDTTNALSQTGEVVFEKLPPWPEREFRGHRNRWLTCRLIGGIRAGEAMAWTIQRVEIAAEVRLRNVPLESAANDGHAIDVSKDFFPFGARPIFGSTLYVGSSAAFSRPGTRVTLNIKLTNPYDAAEKSPIPTVYTDGHPRVSWEYWNGTGWIRLAETDSTKAFRVDGVVGFRVPGDTAPVRINGVENFWIRARLASGSYGEEERWELVIPEDPAAGVKRRPATLAPPSIQSLTIDYELEVGSDSPERAITCNQRVYEDVTQRIRSRAAFSLFGHPCGQLPALYLGFDASGDRTFVNHSVSLYLRIPDRVDRPFSRSGVKSQTGAQGWQYWGQSDWRDLEITDQTGAMSSSGLVSFIVPENASIRDNFTDYGGCYWLRIVARGGSYEAIAQLNGILRNTTMGTHSVILENEVLGSSDGTPNQRYFAARTPILKEIELQLREAELPSEVDRILHSVPGDDVEIQQDPTGRATAAWVRWLEVGDFLGSTPDDRHYTVDRQTGEIRFGNGRQGLIPPRGGNNIRLRRYKTGGGARGNKSAEEINQLRTAIPYVQSVTNRVAAFGGFDLEDMASACRRGARLARHRNRAVTVEDYEDLAHLASPEIARAKCIPMRDLAADPDASRYSLGTVSLIVVSNAKGKKPLSAASLLDHVRRYLDDRRDSAAELVVVGPEYVQVCVEVEFTPVAIEDAGSVVASMGEKVERFLHPLHGGLRQTGWRFGELPHRSDLYGLCASIPGVHHVKSLRIVTIEERKEAIRAGNFLVYSGNHTFEVCSPTVLERQAV